MNEEVTRNRQRAVYVGVIAFFAMCGDVLGFHVHQIAEHFLPVSILRAAGALMGVAVGVTVVQIVEALKEIANRKP